MGGILIIFAWSCSPRLFVVDMTNRYMWLVVVATVSAPGFCRLLSEIHQAPTKGLSAAQKFSGQFRGVGYRCLFLHPPELHDQTQRALLQVFYAGLGWFYIVFVILVIVGSSNAVNLTDGLDGLAIGPVAIAPLAYTIVAYVTGTGHMAEYLLILQPSKAPEKSLFCRVRF